MYSFEYSNNRQRRRHEFSGRRHDRAGFDCGVEPLNRYLKRWPGNIASKGSGGLRLRFPYAVIVDAKDTAAEAFYRKYGFRLCDPEARQLYLPLGAS